MLSTEETPRPEPDPEVFDIPESHWPARDTELVPSYMGAEEVLHNESSHPMHGTYASESCLLAIEIIAKSGL